MSTLRTWTASLAVAAGLFVSLAPGARADAPAHWNLDPAHSRAAFSVRHLGISNVNGEFTALSGAAQFDGKSVDTAAVQATIDANSINTREPKRDGHLKSAEFFDVAHYPTLAFKSRRFRRTHGNKFALTGDLTIHGVTHTVVFDGERTDAIKDPWGNARMGATATTTINRKDFGLTWNKNLDGGGVVVGDNVTITLDVEFVKDGK